MFAHVLRFTVSNDPAAVMLRQPAVACLELIMRKGPMQTLFGQLEQFMKLQPCQPAAVAKLQVVSTGRFGLWAWLGCILTYLAIFTAYRRRPCSTHFACSTLHGCLFNRWDGVCLHSAALVPFLFTQP